MELIALCVLCSALGLVIGYEWGDKSKARPIKGEGEAPKPSIDFDFDTTNPINGRFVRVVPQKDMVETKLYRLH